VAWHKPHGLSRRDGQNGGKTEPKGDPRKR
jgi:hypothetical protein